LVENQIKDKKKVLEIVYEYYP